MLVVGEGEMVKHVVVFCFVFGCFGVLLLGKVMRARVSYLVYRYPGKDGAFLHFLAFLFGYENHIYAGV